MFFAVVIGSFSLGNALPEIETFATALGAASAVYDIIDKVGVAYGVCGCDLCGVCVCMCGVWCVGVVCVCGVNGDWFPPQQSAIDASSDEGETPDDFIGNIQFSDVIFHYPARPDVQVCLYY